MDPKRNPLVKMSMDYFKILKGYDVYVATKIDNCILINEC